MNLPTQVPTHLFTPREADVVRELLKGKSNREIGAALFIAESSVKFHLTKLYKLLGVKSRIQFILRYGRHEGML